MRARDPSYDASRTCVLSTSVFLAVHEVVSKSVAGLIQRDHVEAVLAAGAAPRR